MQNVLIFMTTPNEYLNLVIELPLFLQVSERFA